METGQGGQHEIRMGSVCSGCDVCGSTRDGDSVQLQHDARVAIDADAIRQVRRRRHVAMTTRILRRSAIYTAVACAGVTGAIGLMHLPVARPLLAKLEVLRPVNRVSPEKVERMQGHAVAALMGDVVAPLA